MESLMEMLKAKGLVTTCDFDPRQYAQLRVDALNGAIGDRDKGDGYNCPICKNKGYVARLVENPDGTFSHSVADCKCADTRRSILRMQRSGLKNIIRDYTFDKFQTPEPWQETLKAAAMDYAKNPSGWFALCGQSGCGKTHLCTAICRELLLEGREVVYMLWRDEIGKIKQAARMSEFDGETVELRRILDKYKTAKVLYIDDLFKTGKTAENATQRPTAADINYAFEILNYRYNNPELLTILSTELTEDELLDIDEAIGGRIYERAKAYSIGKDRGKNYRVRNTRRL